MSSLGIGSNDYLYKLAGGMNASVGGGQGVPFGNQEPQISKEDLDVFSAAKINGSEGARGSSFGSNFTKAIQGAVNGASGLFGGISERLAQFDKGQLNHPEQRNEMQGQNIWELA